MDYIKLLVSTWVQFTQIDNLFRVAVYQSIYERLSVWVFVIWYAWQSQ